MDVNKIYTTQKGKTYVDSFLLGNGRTGAMVSNWGRGEKIIVNDECLWSGFKVKDNNQNARTHLDEIRRLVFEGKRDEAQKMASDNFLSRPLRLDPYQVLTEVYVDFGLDERIKTEKIKNFKRSLDMEHCVCETRFKVGNDTYKMISFVSGKDNVGVLRYETDCPDGFTEFNIWPYRLSDVSSTVTEDIDGDILLKGQLHREYTIEKTKEYVEEKWMKFAMAMRLETDGNRIPNRGGFKVRNAKTITVYFTTRTNYDFNQLNYTDDIDCYKMVIDQLDAVKGMSYKDIKKRSDKAFSTVYNRTKFDLPIEKGKKPITSIPKYISNAEKGEFTNDMFVTYYNFSKYLLIASGDLLSELPANLQGIWAWENNPPWNSDFHININLQMNYWLADPANLDVAVDVLTKFMEKMSEPGTETASEMYGARGWAVHHCLTAFGRTGMHDGLLSGILPLAGAWMLFHMFDHYEYTQDTDYLKRIYPLFKGCCEFICDFLVIGPEGKYVTAPSASPENAFVTPEGKVSPLSYGCSIDLEIISITLRNFIYMCKKLGIDDEFLAECNEKFENLMPLQVSKRYGTLQEWIEDYEETEPGHRHVSHLVGLFPGDCIQREDKEIFEAARKTIDRRTENGSVGCSWSVIWSSNFYARFGEGEICEKLLKTYLGTYLYGIFFNKLIMGDNWGFQIDGMLGFASDIHEMLVQSHEGSPDNRLIRLLPALPKNWKDGSIKGIRARSGVTFDINWKNNRIDKVNFISRTDKKVKITFDGIENLKVLCNGEECKVEILDGVLTLDMIKGKKYSLI